MNELAKTALEDGQALRAFMNYFLETYSHLRHEKFSFDEFAFEDRIEFLQFIKEVADFAIQMADAEKLEEPEEYYTNN